MVVTSLIVIIIRQLKSVSLFDHLQGNVVTKDTSGSVYVTESQDTSTLFISSLGKGLEGQYTCNVSSAASQYNYGATATIYGTHT